VEVLQSVHPSATRKPGTSILRPLKIELPCTLVSKTWDEHTNSILGAQMPTSGAAKTFSSYVLAIEQAICFLKQSNNFTFPPSEWESAAPSCRVAVTWPGHSWHCSAISGVHWILWS
jgi:hypothetical protein